LKKRTAEGPVVIVMHRSYQDIELLAKNDQKLEAEYSGYLAKEPNNAVLMYLTARVTRDRKAQRELLLKSTRTDPTLPWSWYALAHDDAESGDWKSCLEMLSHVQQPGKLNKGGDELLKSARLATGHADLVEAEARRKVGKAPMGEDLYDLLNLVDALAVQGKTGEAKDALARWENRLPASMRSSSDMNLIRCAVWYYLGDFAAIKNANKTPDLATFEAINLHALMVTGEHDPLVKRQNAKLSVNGTWDPKMALGLSIAYHLIGNAAEARTWRERAATTFEKYHADARRAAGILRSTEPPRLQEIKDMTLDTPLKCVFVTVLALQFPQQKALSQLARTLNVSRAPDYYLIEKALK
jgi:hypothetical protein